MCQAVCGAVAIGWVGGWVVVVLAEVREAEDVVSYRRSARASTATRVFPS